MFQTNFGEYNTSEIERVGFTNTSREIRIKSSESVSGDNGYIMEERANIVLVVKVKGDFR